MNEVNSCDGYGHDDSNINSILVLLLGHIVVTYIDAVYCYRPSCVVCQSVGRSVTLLSPAEMAEPIEMPFGLRTRLGPRIRFSRGSRSPVRTRNFEEEAAHFKIGTLCRELCKID